MAERKYGLIERLVGTKIDNRPARAAEDAARQKFLASIAHNETGVVRGDPYSFAKPSGSAAMGRDMGRYQVTEGELASYSERYLGGAQKVTPDTFMKNPKMQEVYLSRKYNYYKDKGYTPQQIADIHRRGYKNSGAPGSEVYQDPDYVAKFNSTYLK